MSLLGNLGSYSNFTGVQQDWERHSDTQDNVEHFKFLQLVEKVAFVWISLSASITIYLDFLRI